MSRYNSDKQPMKHQQDAAAAADEEEILVDYDEDDEVEDVAMIKTVQDDIDHDHHHDSGSQNPPPSYSLKDVDNLSPSQGPHDDNNTNTTNTHTGTHSTAITATEEEAIVVASPVDATKNPIVLRARSSTDALSQGEGEGKYIPPFRRRRQLEQDTRTSFEPDDAIAAAAVAVASELPSSSYGAGVEYQRQQWYQLQKNVRGTINRLNTLTLKPLLLDVLQKPHTNLIRGKGILAKSLIQSATISPSHAPVYASFLAVLHSKLPEIGELVLARSILLFRKSYANQDRDRTLSLVNFIGCLFNQGMCHEILCLQMLTLLLADDATDESVEVAIRLVLVVGRKLMECSPAGLHAVMERFRSLLHEGVSQRVQHKLQKVLEVRKKKFDEYPILVPELDFVEEDDQVMLEMALDDEDLSMDEHLDVFEYDDDWVTNEKEWMEIQKEILGYDAQEGGGENDGEGEEEGESETDDTSSAANQSDDEEEDEDGVLVETTNKHTTAITTTTSTIADPSKVQTVIQDMSEKDLIHLRRTIYLTIMSSATFEECAHKLSKMDIPPGREMELINMIIECCSQERTFLRYYGLIASRFCLLHNRWKDAFHQAFIVQYNTIHRLETNKLRNVAKLFAHLLYTDSLSWSCLSVIHLNEDETTSSSRIFLKILVQEMAQSMGMEQLSNRFETKDPEAAAWFQELFPKDHSQPRKTRYAINFFTSIGLGPLTDGLREHLKQAPKLIRMQAVETSGGQANGKDAGDDESDASSVLSSSSSSSTSSSSTSSDSRSTSSSSYSSSSLSSSSKSYYTSNSYRGRDEHRSNRRRRRRDSYSDYSSTSSSVSPSSSSRRRTNKRSGSHHSRRHDRKPKRSSSTRSPTPDRRDHQRSRYRYSSRSSSSSATKDSRDRRRGRNDHTRSRSTRRDLSRDDKHDAKNDSTVHKEQSSYSRSSSTKKDDPKSMKRDSEKSTVLHSRYDKKRRRSISESSFESYRSRDTDCDSRRHSHSIRNSSRAKKLRDK